MTGLNTLEVVAYLAHEIFKVAPFGISCCELEPVRRCLLEIGHKKGAGCRLLSAASETNSYG